MSLSDTRKTFVTQLPASIKSDDEPVFAEPWQAQAFAMAVALIENGSFTWPEWAEAIGGEIARAREHGYAEDGSAYYELWLRALENLVAAKQLAGCDELGRLKDAWRRAYESTPHGQAVTLDDTA